MAAAAARRHYRGLTWLGRARRAGGAPVMADMKKVYDVLIIINLYSSRFQTDSFYFLLKSAARKTSQ